MHRYNVYYEPADNDDPRKLLGEVQADTASDALDKAAQYWEIPQYDLAVELIKEEH